MTHLSGGDNNNANLIDYASIKSHRVVASVIGTETFGVADVCNVAITVQREVKSLLKKTVKMNLLTDSAALLNVLIRNGNTTARSLIKEIKASRSYNDGIIDDIIWIRRKINLAEENDKTNHPTRTCSRISWRQDLLPSRTMDH